MEFGQWIHAYNTIILEWSKYHKKKLKERYFRQAITIQTIPIQYFAKSIKKITCVCMNFGEWIHAPAWNHIIMVKMS
jgi:hypothetical protein